MMARAAVDPSRPFLRARSTARSALLDAARRIAEREGVDAVSLGSVADEVGFARATAYANFCSRDELLQAVVAEDLSVLLRAMRSAMGLPEPPSHPPPPTRIVRVEFQRPRDDVFNDALEVQDGGAAVEEGIADSDNLPLKLFRDACNDRFEIKKQHELVEAGVDDDRSFDGRGAAQPVHDNSQPEERAGSLARLEQKIGLFERSLTVLDERLSVVADSSPEAHALAQRLAALEQKHEQTLIGMMAEIRALSERLRDRVTPVPVESPAESNDQTEDPEPLLLTSPVPETEEAPAEKTETDQAGEPQLGWTIKFSNENLSRTEQVPVATPTRLLPVQMVVAQPETRSRTRRIVIGLAACAVLLGTAGVALRFHSANVAPSVSNATLHVGQTHQPHKSAKHIVRSEAPVDRLSMQAESGEPDAELAIGLKYLNGEGTTKNEAVGAGWIARSALRGNTLAQYYLASLYEHGRGVATDPVQAFAWYEKAALGGNKKAMHNLAVAYAQGSGVAKDMSEAARWFSRAASLGYVDSAFNLAVLYERGEGVPQSLLDAYKWYAIAAAQGDAESKLRINAIQSELSPEAVAAADKAAAAFKVDPSEPKTAAAGSNAATP